MPKKNYNEYYKIVRPILENKEFQKRKNFPHHGKISVYDHSLKVSKISYNIAKKFKLDYKSAAIGGLLHDFYYKPWQNDLEKKKFFKQHGFIHATEALENSKNIFPNLMNEKVENIIKRHMFPLNITPPTFKESWLVSFVDKYVSLQIFKEPKNLYKYIGIKSKKDKKDKKN